jgi:hypothetical protein
MVSTDQIITKWGLLKADFKESPAKYIVPVAIFGLIVGIVTLIRKRKKNRGAYF